MVIEQWFRKIKYVKKYFNRRVNEIAKKYQFPPKAGENECSNEKRMKIVEKSMK